MRDRFFGVLLFLVIINTSCTDEFSLDRDSLPIPIIEGLVVDEPESSFVRISFSSDISSTGNNDPVPASNAVVIIFDGSVITPFCEKEPGLYRSEDVSFQGEIGLSYQMLVQLEDGRSFISSTEILNEGLEIDSLFAEFQGSTIPGSNGSHKFFITTSDQGGLGNSFFRVESSGIAEVAAILDPPFSPDGFPCGDPCVEICWSFRDPINTTLVLGNSEDISGAEFTLEVANQPYDFSGRYFIEVTLFSLSQEGFLFWESVADQLEIDGSIFDPQLGELRNSNVFNSETNDPVIGYFGASSVSRGSLIFNRFDLAGFTTTVPTTDQLSCTEVWPRATLVRPPQF